MAATYLIVGAGRFGRLAWQRLQQLHPRATFCLVDREPEKLAFFPAHSQTQTVAAPADAFLAQVLAHPPWPEWIIPAVPIHLAYAWLRRSQPAGACWQPLAVPAGLGEDLPFRQVGGSGEVYLSLATERCPDDCPEPAGRCSLTGAVRSLNLFDYLARQQLPGGEILVVRSHQLAPGVGGYRPEALLRLREEVIRAGAKLIVCTACRCHGVCHGLAKRTGREAEVGL